MVVSRQQVRRSLVVLLVAMVATTADAVEVRHVAGSRYSVDLARAYAPCLAPNTFSSTGILACSPAVTSACNYSSGALDLRKREDVKEIDLFLRLNNVSGPGNCTIGPYTLKLGLRVSADDSSCAGGECTLVDFETSVPLVLAGNNFKLDPFTLESALPGLPPAIANYELRHAYILAPDGKPIAGAGTEDDNSADVRADLSTAYPECIAPDTINAWGVPACSAPVWESACDFTLVDVNFNRTPAGPRIQPRALGLTGAPAACADGTYEIIPRVRITTDDCGTLCTLVDLDLPLLATAVRGEFDLSTVLLSTNPLVGFLSDNDDVELLGLVVRDPLGNLLAGSAVTPTLRIDRARVTATYRDPGDPSDDALTIKGEFPHPVIDPSVGGATFTVAGKSGTAYTATIPAGGWIAKGPTPRWVYRDDLGTINGVQHAEIREFRRRGSPTGFKVRLVARDTSASATNLPALNVVVAVSDGGAGSAVATRGTVCRQSTNRITCK